MNKISINALPVGVQVRREQDPILDVGVLQGRLWVLRLEARPLLTPETPTRSASAGERVAVALAVLRSAVRLALGQATSGLRDRWRRTGK